MSLVNPEWLTLLALIPLFWFALHFVNQRGKKDALGLLSPQRLQAQWPGFASLNTLHTLLLLAAFFLLCVALLRPTYGYRVETYETAASEIVLAVDTSSSMLAEDVQPSRMERAKWKVRDFIERAAGDRIGLVAFAGSAFVQTPLTEDGRALRLFLDEIDTELIPVPGTRVDIAIDTALEALGKSRDSSAGKDRPGVSADAQAIVLITDGESAAPEALAAAERALQQGVRVSVLGIGTPDGAPIPDRQGGFKRDARGQMVVSRLEEEQLSQIAARGGGVYVSSVSSDADLRALYDQGLKQSLGAGGERSQRRRLPIDVFQFPLFLSFVCLFLDTWLRWCRRRARAPFSSVKAPAARASRPTRARMGATRALLFLFMTIASILCPVQSEASDFLNGADRRARAHYDGREFDDAARSWKERIGGSEKPQPQDLYNLGAALYRSGKYAEAAEAFAAAGKGYAEEAQKAEDPAQQQENGAQAADALHNLGNAELLQGRAQEAVRAYEGALGLRPEDSGTQQNLAQARALLREQQQKREQSGEDGDQREQNGDPNEQAGGKPDQKNGDPNEQAGGKPDQKSGDPNEQAGGKPDQKSGDPNEQADGRKKGTDGEQDSQSASAGQDGQKQDERTDSAAHQNAASAPEPDKDKADGGRSESVSAQNDAERSDLSPAELQKIMGQVNENPRRYLQYKARQQAQKQIREYGAPKEGGQDW